MEPTIKKATLEDVSALNRLVNSAYRGESSKKGWTTEAHLLEGTRTTEAELIEIISKKENGLFIYVEEEILGCVLLIQKINKLYLGMLTVNPDLQNKGIGKRLLDFAEAHAKNLNLNAVEMTVIATRQELIAYYNRKGYLDTEKREAFSNELNRQVIEGAPALEFVVLEKKL
jgi:ribosomal protein S18 acetylase RimI-like enzyme